jgi:hypothetical protein
MRNPSHKIDRDLMMRSHTEPTSESPRIDRVAKGIATGVAASLIVQTGKSAAGTLVKNPLFVFGMGLMVGYFASKYRKEILSVSRQAAKQSSDFVARQKENLKEFIVECQESPVDPEDAN